MERFSCGKMMAGVSGWRRAISVKGRDMLTMSVLVIYFSGVSSFFEF